MTRRETAYAILVALGVLLPMYYNVQYLGAGGNLLMDFFTAPMQSAVTASLLFDLLIAFAAYTTSGCLRKVERWVRGASGCACWSRGW